MLIGDAASEHITFNRGWGVHSGIFLFRHKVLLASLFREPRKRKLKRKEVSRWPGPRNPPTHQLPNYLLKPLLALKCSPYTPRPIWKSSNMIRSGRWAIPASFLLRAAYSPRCTADAYGPCASIPAWAMLRNRINVTNICWPTG